MMISRNFRLFELLRSGDHPDLAARASDLEYHEVVNLCRLVYEVLQPARDLVEAPVWVTSGYRSRLLQRAVRGDEPSVHTSGRAADIVVPGMAPTDFWELLIGSDVPFDRAAFYPAKGHVHVEVAVAGDKPRRLVYIADPEWVLHEIQHA